MQKQHPKHNTCARNTINDSVNVGPGDEIGCITSGLISKALIVLSLYFPTKVISTIPKYQKLCIRLVIGTARISILKKKQNLDCNCMTEKLNDYEQLSCLLLLSTSRQLVTAENGTTMIY